MTKITQIQSMWEPFAAWVIPFLPRFISAILIVCIGLPLARYLQRKSLRKIQGTEDPTLKSFLINLIYILSVIFIGISALTTLGVASTSLLTVLGAASLAIGFALKDFLSNIAAGFMLIFLRPFKVGDDITVQNITGTVNEINLFLTVLHTAGNEALFIPNKQIVNNTVTNQTYYPLRCLNISLGIAYESDIQKARDILIQEMLRHPEIQAKPTPSVSVQNLGESAIQLTASSWVTKNAYGQIKADLLEGFKMRLEEAHIVIPYPQLNVHIAHRETP